MTQQPEALTLTLTLPLTLTLTLNGKAPDKMALELIDMLKKFKEDTAEVALILSRMDGSVYGSIYGPYTVPCI